MTRNKIYGFLLGAIILFSFSNLTAWSLLSSTTIVSNSGSILTISPLHVEGNLIKTSFGTTIMLKGINKVEFADNPGGAWMGIAVPDYARWRQSDVRSELAKMREWGVNTVRAHQAVEHWKYNMGNHRQITKEFLNIAAEYGMYVIYDGYCVRDYWNGASQDPLPYPPYQTSQNASAVIANENDFIAWWVSIASELKEYPNVIFELWNEPTGNATAKASWFNVAQRCISAIRSTGATQLIIFQWEMGVYVNLDYPPPSNPAAIMDWVWQANLTDPLNNLVMSTHLYRCYGVFQHTVPSRYNAYNYTDIQLAFQYYKFPEVIAQYPLIIGEIGADIVYTGDELQHELTAFDNCFKLFDVLGIHYTAFWWRSIGVFALHNGSPDFVPNGAGEIVAGHLLD